MRRVVVKKAKNLTLSELRSCYAMSYRNNGDLQPWLCQSRHGDGADDVILVKEDGLIIGWGMRLKDSGETGYWVRKSHRRKGIGTVMVKRAKKLGKIKTHPHSYESAKMFAKAEAFDNKKVERKFKTHIKNYENGKLKYRTGWDWE